MGLFAGYVIPADLAVIVPASLVAVEGDRCAPVEGAGRVPLEDLSTVGVVDAHAHGLGVEAAGVCIPMCRSSDLPAAESACTKWRAVVHGLATLGVGFRLTFAVTRFSRASRRGTR